MDEVEKLRNAATLIKDMTHGQQNLHTGVGGCYIQTGDNVHFGLQMRVRPHIEQGCYKITFDAYSRTMGAAMSSGEVMRLIEEAGQIHALLTALEMQEFVPSEQEYRQFITGMASQEAKTVGMGEMI